MQGYITAILVMAVAVFLMQAIAPDAKGLRAAIGCAASVAVLAVLLFPPGEVKWDLSFPNLSHSAAVETGKEAYLSTMAKGYEEGIGEDLKREWGLSDFTVRVKQDEYGVPLLLTVALHRGDVVADGVGIRRYAEERYGIPCEILYE